jgi:hypothetical protein
MYFAKKDAGMRNGEVEELRLSRECRELSCW